jgi:hypothetical protein
VAHDAFRSTIEVADARRWPIALALEMDGRPIPRAGGGPLFLVFPHATEPASARRYNDRYWSFYVTHMIVGTEPIALRVGDRALDAAALAALAPVDLVVRARFNGAFWPSTAVELRGVRMADALAAAGVALPEEGSVVALGKAPIQRDALDPVRFRARDVRDCGILLVSRWGPRREPIPAGMGGPLAIAIPDACAARHGDRHWMTFVQELVVEAKAAP